MYEFQRKMPLSGDMIAEEIYNKLKENYKVKNVITFSSDSQNGCMVETCDGRDFEITIEECK